VPTQIFKDLLIALGAGFLIELTTQWIGSSYLHDFFDTNLISILVALLAINAATMGIVLSRIREIIENNPDSKEKFEVTRRQMLLTTKEQIGLVCAAAFFLTVRDASEIARLLRNDNVELLLNSLIVAVFVYALRLLYDTAKSVLIIVDFPST
jgi:hypothetical protein